MTSKKKWLCLESRENMQALNFKEFGIRSKNQIKILEEPYYAASIYASLTFCNHRNDLKQQEHLWKSCNVIGSRLGVP